MKIINRKKIIILFLIVLLLPIISSNFKYFPEDFSDIDYLTNKVGEVFMGSYYNTDPAVVPAITTLKYDYRNGIIINPFNDVYKKLNQF